MTDRAKTPPFDIILFGATGFAGALLAEYFAEVAPDLRWAVAGRSRAKLDATVASLRRKYPELDEVPVVVADSHDRDSLDAMVTSTRVVATTVGPYARFGSGLVAACAEHGVDYCDITGEVQWIQRMIARHHEGAVASGARIVHCCGFDSIPSDLGALMMQRAALERFGAPCEEIGYYLRGASGGFSGGTIASMTNLMEEIGRDKSVRRVLGHPYSLNPEGEQRGPDGSLQQGPRRDEMIGEWTAPFLMAGVNEKIVRRSNALRSFEYGRDFRYHESVATGGGSKGAVSAAAMAAGLGAAAGALALGPTRALLKRFVLPAAGEGPDRDTLERGYFKVELRGRGRDGAGRAFELKGTVKSDRDPGYRGTAQMLAQSALALAEEPDPDGLAGGVLTPASSLGMTLVERLRQAGMRWSVDAI